MYAQRIGSAASPCTVGSENAGNGLPIIADGSSAGSTNQLVLPNQSAYLVKGIVVAKQDSSAQSKTWEFTAHIMRGANAGTTTLVNTVTPTMIGETGSATTWALAVTADTIEAAEKKVVFDDPHAGVGGLQEAEVTRVRNLRGPWRWALIVGLTLLHQVPRPLALVGIILVIVAGIGATRSGERGPAEAAAPEKVPVEVGERSR